MKWSKRILSIIFVLVIGGISVVNVMFSGRAMWDEIKSVDDIKDTTTIENIINTNTYRKTDYIELYSYIQLLLDKDEIGNFDIVKSENANLNYGDFYHEINADIEEYADRMLRLKEYATAHDCEVIYINTVPLYTDTVDTYSRGIPYQDTNIDEDVMLYHLQKRYIDYLDVREALKGSDLPKSKYHYKTDHHWTVEASFESFKAIVEKLNNEYNEDLDPNGIYTNINSYTSITYPNSFVGTLSRRAGIPFGGVDDFTLIVPNFDSKFHVITTTDEGETEKWGGFGEALIDERYLSTKDPYLQSLYTAYLGGSVPLRHIENMNNEEGPKALLIHDSFSLPTATFLSTVMSEIDMIWPMSDEMYDYVVDINAYLEENIQKYDYIFIELVPGNFSDEGFAFMEE